MNKPLIYGLIITGFNVFAFMVMLRALDNMDRLMGSVFIGLPGVVLFTELVLGLIFNARGSRKHFGAGLLMSVALTMFIALVAGFVWMGTFTW